MRSSSDVRWSEIGKVSKESNQLEEWNFWRKSERVGEMKLEKRWFELKEKH